MKRSCCDAQNSARTSLSCQGCKKLRPAALIRDWGELPRTWCRQQVRKQSAAKWQQNQKPKAPRTNWGPSFVPRFGAPGGIRTHNPWVRSPVLYPLSYRRELWTSTHLGRATGFEPVISCATDRRLGPLGYARRDARGPGGSPKDRGMVMVAKRRSAFKERRVLGSDLGSFRNRGKGVVSGEDRPTAGAATREHRRTCGRLAGNPPVQTWVVTVGLRHRSYLQ